MYQPTKRSLLHLEAEVFSHLYRLIHLLEDKDLECICNTPPEKLLQLRDAPLGRFIHARFILRSRSALRTAFQRIGVEDTSQMNLLFLLFCHNCLAGRPVFEGAGFTA